MNWLLCVSALLLLLAGPGGATAANDSAARPNFLFILADDLGWADLQSYGSTFHETPNLDRLAREGMRFSTFYAAGSVCSPTRSSIMKRTRNSGPAATAWRVNVVV